LLSARRSAYNELLPLGLGVKSVSEPSEQTPGYSSSNRRSVVVRAGMGVGLFLLALYLLSGFYVLQPDEQAIVERFGRPLNAESPSGPGLHYRLPWPIDQVRRESTGRVRVLSLGYQGRVDPEAILWTNIDYQQDEPMLTGHRRSGGAGPQSERTHVFVNARVFVHYRIARLQRFLYACEDPEAMLRAVAERALRREIGRRELFPLLSTQRGGLEEALSRTLRDEADALGVTLTSVHIRDIHPPQAVAGAFQKVVSAMEERETLQNAARRDKTRTVEAARTDALAGRRRADGDALLARAIAQGQAIGYGELAAVYRQHRGIVRVRMYMDLLAGVLESADVVIVPGTGREGPELWLLPGGQAAPVMPVLRPGSLVPRPPTRTLVPGEIDWSSPTAGPEEE